MLKREGSDTSSSKPHVRIIGVRIESHEVIGGLTNRAFGSLSTRADSPEVVDQRYRLVAEQMKIDVNHLFCLPQTHSNNVVVLRDKAFLQRPEGPRRYQFSESDIRRGEVHLDPTDFDMEWQRGIDGVIMSVQDLYPVILTADCAPVMFWAPESQVCGIAHIGLVGAVNQLAIRMVSLMQSEFGVDPRRIQVMLFPSIRGCHYNIERSGVWKRLQRSIKELYGEDNPHYKDGFFHLPEFIIGQLESAGVRRKHIDDLETCTVCKADEFFSHVQAGVTGTQAKEGRFGSLIGMRPRSDRGTQA